MNTVRFFGKSVTRLIVGDNPFNGHSYIEYQTTGQEMKSFYTAGKILETLSHIEASGINTILPLADPFIVRLLAEYERSGGKLQYIFQPYMPMNQDVSIRQLMELQGTIGIYHQGTTTDFLFESGRCEEIRSMLAKYRSMGIPVGLGTHRPDVIRLSEKEGWDVDFYMACLQNARRNREGEASGFLTGKTKASLRFYPEDRPIMLDLIASVPKPVIAFKIFAGGQIFHGKTEAEKRDAITGVYEEVFTAIKPGDMAAIGIFQRDRDELAEDVQLYEQWYAAKNQ
ncbi:MAG: hypothetical protein IJB52_17040 [Clostridia bacterium]|nr:hypothetical protein [Clostridia bacterium]